MLVALLGLCDSWLVIYGYWLGCLFGFCLLFELCWCLLVVVVGDFGCFCFWVVRVVLVLRFFGRYNTVCDWWLSDLIVLVVYCWKFWCGWVWWVCGGVVGCRLRFVLGLVI